MSMSTLVYGIKNPNDKSKKMLAVYDACNAAGTTIPKEVCDFFDNETPDPKGVLTRLHFEDGASEYYNESESGIDVDLSKIPKDITVIRFVNSW